jgi:hypothetical protein
VRELTPVCPQLIDAQLVGAVVGSASDVCLSVERRPPRARPRDHAATRPATTSPQPGIAARPLPLRILLGERLSPAVRDQVPAIVGVVLDELARLGAPAQPKANPRRPAFWWERPEPSSPALEVR